MNIFQHNSGQLAYAALGRTFHTFTS
jgi:hypothetical protein